MIPPIDYSKIQTLAESLTEQELARYREKFNSLARTLSAGAPTVLKHLNKIQATDNVNSQAYEYELSDFFKSFLIFMENEFKGKNQDLKSAIILKIISEQSSNPK